MRSAMRQCFVVVLKAVLPFFVCANAAADSPLLALGAKYTMATSSTGSLKVMGIDYFGNLGIGSMDTVTSPIPVEAVASVRGVAAGLWHTLALRSDGLVWAWGENSDGQLGDRPTAQRSRPGQVLGLADVAAVAAGGAHSLALKQDGSVWGWGENCTRQPDNGSAKPPSTPVQVLGVSDVIAIATSNDTPTCHTVVLRKDGTIWAWGNNSAGSLGDGTFKDRSTPAPVAGLSGVKAISTGLAHGVAVHHSGAVYTWGDNTNGQLGNGTTNASAVPVQALGLTGVVAVAAGDNFTIALKSDGTVWAWGDNSWGTLGDGTTEDRHLPQLVPGPTGVVTISAGPFHAMATTRDGTAWTWGDNSVGQLGDGSTNERLRPIMVSTLSGVVSGAVGESFTVVNRLDGTAWTWGENSYDQLGISSYVWDAGSTPTSVPGMTDVTAIATANAWVSSHTLALKSDGTLWAWGDNYAGQLGDGTDTDRKVPTRVQGLADVIALAVGGWDGEDESDGHSVALKRDGTVWTWGDNSKGQLGDSTSSNRLLPAQAKGIGDVTAISASQGKTLVLKADRTVWRLDQNGGTQVAGLTDVTSVVAGVTHDLAVRRDGTVWAWGSNGFGELGDGTTTPSATPVKVLGAAGVTVVASGHSHSLALGKDGSVMTWGDNSSGQLGSGNRNTSLVPQQVPGLSRIVAIGGGGYHSAALRVDGTVVTWGDGYSGQLGDGTLSPRPSPGLVVTQYGDGFLNLKEGTTARIPPALNVPFFVDTSGTFSDTTATIATKIKINPADVGKVGSIYVFASVPSAALPASAGIQSGANARPNRAAAQTIGNFECLTLSTQGLMTNSQIVPFFTGVLNEFSSLLTISDKTKIGGYGGAEYSVIYDATSQQMVDSSNAVNVATLPGGTHQNACKVGAPVEVRISVSPGWNLLGNPVKKTLVVAEKFGDSSKVTSVWKWDADASKWQFYTPQLDSSALQSYAASQGYGVLSEIEGGDGYWVDAKSPAELGTFSGPPISPLRPNSLASGWNLMATSGTITPQNFNLSLSTTPPTTGQVPINLASLWAWDPAQSRWYFYAPSLEAQGGSVLADYVTSQDYKDFSASGKTLGLGQGFWVNRP
jgi:alpha-tubulin suppressor-like RCC1 family protein